MSNYKFIDELKINEKMAIITQKVDDKICQSWRLNKQDVIDSINFKQTLIKYLEDKIEIYSKVDVDGCISKIRCGIYQEILSKVKELSLFEQGKGEGQGSCKKCESKGKWNRAWMTFLYKNKIDNKYYCLDCMKEYLDKVKEGK